MPNLELDNLTLPQPLDGLKLRRWQPQDSACVMSAAKDPYIPLVTTIPAQCDELESLDWIERQNQKIIEGTDLPLCIALDATNEPLGMVGIFGLTDLLMVNARCGYWVNPQNRGQKISGRALSILSAWAFEFLPLDTLELLIEPDNAGSLSAARLAGYSFKCTLLAHTEIGDIMRDVSLYARSRSAIVEAKEN